MLDCLCDFAFLCVFAWNNW